MYHLYAQKGEKLVSIKGVTDVIGNLEQIDKLTLECPDAQSLIDGFKRSGRLDEGVYDGLTIKYDGKEKPASVLYKEIHRPRTFDVHGNPKSVYVQIKQFAEDLYGIYKSGVIQRGNKCDVRYAYIRARMEDLMMKVQNKKSEKNFLTDGSFIDYALDVFKNKHVYLTREMAVNQRIASEKKKNGNIEINPNEIKLSVRQQERIAADEGLKTAITVFKNECLDDRGKIVEHANEELITNFYYGMLASFYKLFYDDDKFVYRQFRDFYYDYYEKNIREKVLAAAKLNNQGQPQPVQLVSIIMPVVTVENIRKKRNKRKDKNAVPKGQLTLKQVYGDLIIPDGVTRNLK